MLEFIAFIILANILLAVLNFVLAMKLGNIHSALGWSNAGLGWVLCANYAIGLAG